jgi:hypothetical protein
LDGAKRKKSSFNSTLKLELSHYSTFFLFNSNFFQCWEKFRWQNKKRPSVGPTPNLELGLILAFVFCPIRAYFSLERSLAVARKKRS